MSKDLRSVDRRINQEIWPELMLKAVQPVYSKIKERKKECIKLGSLQQYHQCVRKLDEQAVSLNLSMEYFNNKYNTCIEEGREISYREKDVKRFCKQKIFKAAKAI